MLNSGNFQVARIGGIPIEVHFTFGLTVFMGIWYGWERYRGLTGIAYGVFLLGLLFVCIFLHELGHGLQARALHLSVRRIILLPIGGMTQLEKPPTHPWQDLLVTLAGPVINLALGIGFVLGVYLLEPFPLQDWALYAWQLFLAPPGLAGALFYLAVVNFSLFGFNMLPAFPMDGGRVLRAGLALIIDYELATRLSSWLGRLIAAGLAVLGLFGWPPAQIAPNPLFVLVAIIIFSGAHQEEVYVRRQRALVRLDAHHLLRRNVEVTAPWDAISQQLMSRLYRQDHVMPVLMDGRLMGLLIAQDVHRARGRGGYMTVAHLMRTHFPVLRLGDTLWVALQEMHTYQLPALPVVEDGIFQGIVSLDDINHAWRFPSHHRRSGSTLVSGEIPQ